MTAGFPLRLPLLALAFGSSSIAADEPSQVKAEIIEVSPGWTCPDQEASLRAFERRVRIAFIGQQRPQIIHTSRPGASLWGKGRRVPDEEQLADWARWRDPVVVTLLLRPRPTMPPETTRTDPHGYSDVTVTVSSGVSHVDGAASLAAIASGGGRAFEGCERNFWRLHLTFRPPQVPSEQQPRALLAYLEDADAWARFLAATDLLSLGHYQKEAREALQTLVAHPDDRLREAVSRALAPK